MTDWLSDILDFAFPRRCHVCGGNLAPHERFACSHCLASLPRTGYHRRRLNPMEERFAGHFPFVRATGHFFYTRESSLSILIQDMKYRRFPAIGEMLGGVVAAELYPSGFFDGIDCVVAVPMHYMKRIRRGYNQTDHIALGISRAAGVPVVRGLRAVRPHRTQTALTLEQRRDNTAGIFRAPDPSLLEGRGVLLVDDVCTTGATLSAAATEIMRAAPGCRLTLLSLGVTF